jgi:hypothetical protein
MTAVRGYDWQLSNAAHGSRMSSGEFVNFVDFELEELEKVTVGFKQELLSALAVAGLVLAAYALL